MKALTVFASALLIALASTLAGCNGGGSGEVVSTRNIKGSGKTEANNGAAGDTKDTAPKDKPADITEAKQAPAFAKGRVSDAFNVTGIAHAERPAGAAGAGKASAKATITSTSAFTLKQDGKVIAPRIEPKLAVTLNGDDAEATIKILMRITKGGAESAKYELTYTYKPNKANPAKIDLTGAHTETLDNGQTKSYDEKSPNEATLNKGDYNLELTLTITTSGSVLAEANAKEVKLSVSK
jgi:hypothetical protein